MISEINKKIIGATMAFILEEYEIDVLNKPTCRLRNLVDFRALTMKVIRECTKLSLTEIGSIWKTKSYKGKDHATVLHNISMFNTLIETDNEFSEKYRKIFRLVNEFKFILSKENKNSDLFQELKKERQKYMSLINRDLNRKQIIITLQKKIDRLPERYQQELLSVFKINESIYKNKNNISI